MRLPVASGILQVAHPRSSIPKPRRNLPLASLSAVCYAHLARSSTRTAISRANRSPEKLRIRWWNSPPPNCRDDAGSPLGIGDPPPDYSMFQESAPRTLVIGEEHFTFLGYHSERRCQVLMQTSWAVTRGHFARIVLHGHLLAAYRLLAEESRSSPSSSARRRRRHCSKATSRSDRNPTGR